MDTQDIRHALAADEVDAWARHAHTASGFGDGALPPAEGPRRTCLYLYGARSIAQPHVDSAPCANRIEVSKPSTAAPGGRGPRRS